MAGIIFCPKILPRQPIIMHQLNRLANKKNNRLLMTALSNDTIIDIIYLNTLGESEVLFSEYTQEKDKDTIVTIDSEKMDEFLTKDVDQFLLVLNNKDDDMLLDILAVNEGINPGSTSFQRIIKLIPYEK
ncbi:hypothetical protein [Paenibacillus sp. SYP-B4298]|uniref:hypothetical protein n=1 Tax=Paenibacillus sp. SYP-B4298 TaxID=2996034 RepID=UPI0022DD464F|nr:hypothetical protein [Paenibacillus sp. SYP-B4298]